MFKKIMILVITIVMLNTVEVKADTVINIKIPENVTEVKIPQHTMDEFYMLQKIVVAEAHDQSPELMAEIMLCILNRVESDKFPNTIEGVIKEKGQFSTYPKLYEKYEPNETSLQALLLIPFMENKGQLFFENPKQGSWISTHKEYIFSNSNVYFYK